MQQEVDSNLRLLTQFKGENGIGRLSKACRVRENGRNLSRQPLV